MGFPQRGAEDLISICSCHKKVKSGAEGYICPRCKVNVCELPTECRTCGLTLVSSPHLARSYHHLFPVAPFDEVTFKLGQKGGQSCYGCQQSLINSGMLKRITAQICNLFYLGYLSSNEEMYFISLGLTSRKGGIITQIQSLLIFWSYELTFSSNCCVNVGILCLTIHYHVRMKFGHYLNLMNKTEWHIA